MSVRLCILVIACCLVSGNNPALCQQRRIDSLEMLLDTAGPSRRALILSELSWVYHMSNPDKGLKCGMEALNFFVPRKMEKEQAEALLNIGICYYQLDNFGQAINYFFQSLKTKEKLNDLNGVAALYNNMGNVYKDMTNFPKSNESYRKALGISQKSGNYKILATTLGNLAVNFKIMQRFDSAIIYNLEALRIRDSIGDIRGSSGTLNNIATIFADTAYRGMNRDKALYYFKRSLKAKEEIGDRRGIGLCMVNIGQLYADQKSYQKAVLFFDHALKISYELKAPTLTMACYENLANLYREKGDFRKAYAFLSDYSSMKDSIFTLETTQKVAEMQVKYETGQKENENELLRKEAKIQELQINKQKNLRNYLIMTAVLILAFTISLFNRYLAKRKINRLLEEKNRQLALLNATKDKFFSIIAHDLKNPFSALMAVTAQLSEKYHSLEDDHKIKIIGLIRNSADHTYRLLENLLEWSLSQTGSLTFQPENFDLSALIDASFAFIRLEAEKKELSLVSEIGGNTWVFADKNMIATILNNLLTNAVKFTDQPGMVKVTGTFDGAVREITVRDEGIGMTDEDLRKLFRIDINTNRIGKSKEKGTGLGLLLCKEFIEKNGGKIHAASEPGKGSAFTFTLPVAMPQKPS
jgi:signal transduction histidine kinase